MKTFSKIASNWPLVYIAIIVLVALFAPFIANEKPILIKDNAGYSFTAFDQSNKKYSKEQILIKPIIQYGPNEIDKANMKAIGPFEEQVNSKEKMRHILGTDELGRDLLAMLIHACKTAFFIASGAAFLAFLIGLIIGATAGYYANSKQTIRIAKLISLFVSVLISLVYFTGIFQASNSISTLFFASIFLGGLLHFFLFKILNKMIKKTISIPVDQCIQALIIWLDALPIMFVIIGISAIINPSVLNLILIIALFAWTSTARHARAEVLRLKNFEFVESGKALGYSPRRILFRHILPNAKSTLLTNLAFMMAGAILLESTLSFLGIGLGIEYSSWGSIIAAARNDLSAWWLVLFPGLLLFLSVFAFNKLAEKYSS